MNIISRILLVSIAFMLLSCYKSLDGTSDLTPKERQKLEAASFNTELGIAYLKKGNMVRAKKKLMAALSEAPNLAKTNSAMAYFMERTGEPEQAEYYHKKAVSLPTTEGAQYNNYGTYLCRYGQYASAEKYFLKAAHDLNYSNTAAAYENAGLCAKDALELKKAKDYFKMALQKDPERKQTLFELVRLQEKEGAFREAFDSLKQYVKLVYTDSALLKRGIFIAKRLGYIESMNQYRLHLKQLSEIDDYSGVKHEHNDRTG